MFGGDIIIMLNLGDIKYLKSCYNQYKRLLNRNKIFNNSNSTANAAKDHAFQMGLGSMGSKPLFRRAIGLTTVWA